MNPKFTIIGAGIAGLTTAIALQRAGFETEVFEAAPQFGEVGAGLGMGANAIKAFYKLGMGDEVIAAGRVLPVFSIYDENGRAISTANNPALKTKYGVDNFMIHRAALQKLLLSKLDPGCIHSQKRVVDFTQDGQEVNIEFQDGTVHKTNCVVVADGIHSLFRTKLIPGAEPRYAGYTCWRAVIEKSKLEIAGSSETWGAHGRFGIGPLAQNKIYWFACINAPMHSLQMKNYRVQNLHDHFKGYHEPIPTILEETNDAKLIWGDIFDIKPLRQFAFQNIVLIGDAAHATTPNLGQGACQAIEDAVILAVELKNNIDVQEAFKRFEQRRLKRVATIIKRSRMIGHMAQLENKRLVKMRNAVMRMLPQSFNDQQLKFLYEVDF